MKSTVGHLSGKREAPQVHELLDRMEETGPPCDLRESLNFPLALGTLEVLLGVPAQDQKMFRGWVDMFFHVGGDHTTDDIAEARTNLRTYVEGLTQAKRRQPGDDIISALIAARDEDDALTEYELVWWSQGVLLGGYETTANHLGSGIINLLTHPDELALLRNDASLVPRAVEECLRTEVLLGSLAALRYADDDITLDGVVIPKGAGVIPLMESANYDESVFPEPDTFDIRRPNSHRHMAFSSGPHRCVRAAVARIELHTAMTALLHRFPNLRLAVDPSELRRQQGGVIEGFVHIPVTW